LLQISTKPAFLLSFFQGQIEYMKRNGFEVAAISSGGEQAVLVEQKYGIKVYPVSMQRKVSIFNDIVSLFNLFRTIKALRPTIVHVHTAKASFLGLIAAYLAGVPVRVLTLHGLRSTNSSGMKKKAIEYMEIVLCLFAHKIFLVSESSFNEIRSKNYPHLDRMIIPANGSWNGIDARETFNPKKYPRMVRTQMRLKYGIPEDAIVLCYAGRIVRDKGIIELAQAWSKLRSEFENLYLLMVGEYEKEYSLGQEVEKTLNNDNRVIITGFVQNMPEYYLMADIVTLPTYREGFPYTPLEAAAMGLPVVATRVIGCVDAVEDNRTGILVPVKDSEALYEAIKKLLANKGLREELGKNARERVLDKFAPEQIWKAILDEYIDIMRKRNVLFSLSVSSESN
jgi:glycosyltransferase involved in cell wall biosynthesis